MTSKSGRIINYLKNILVGVGFSLVTTRQLSLFELADSDFDAVILTTGEETQSVLNQGESDATLNIALNLYAGSIPSQNLDAKENWREKAALIGKTVASNRNLGGLAIKAEITGKRQDFSIYEPWASGTINLTIRYRFNELADGG